MQNSEGEELDHKSLRIVTGKTADFNELAKDCVCFANGRGGQLLIGIEDDTTVPPSAQCVQIDLLGQISKRIAQLTVNVTVVPELRTHSNGGEYIALTIPRSSGVASTSDGRYYLRIGDSCIPVVGDDVLRLASDRSVISWETMTSLRLPTNNTDDSTRLRWIKAIRQSDRVKDSVKEKTDAELLIHYELSDGKNLTNLGILLIGTKRERSTLGTAPVIQAIRYVEPHRLHALIVEDVERYPGSAASDIHRRIGEEVKDRTFSRALKQVVDEGRVTPKGEKKGRRYHPN